MGEKGTNLIVGFFHVLLVVMVGISCGFALRQKIIKNRYEVNIDIAPFEVAGPVHSLGTC